jgi:hypothetical protein
MLCNYVINTIFYISVYFILQNKIITELIKKSTFSFNLLHYFLPRRFYNRSLDSYNMFDDRLG